MPMMKNSGGFVRSSPAAVAQSNPNQSQRSHRWFDTHDDDYHLNISNLGPLYASSQDHKKTPHIIYCCLGDYVNYCQGWETKTWLTCIWWKWTWTLVNCHSGPGCGHIIFFKNERFRFRASYLSIWHLTFFVQVHKTLEDFIRATCTRVQRPQTWQIWFVQNSDIQYWTSLDMSSAIPSHNFHHQSWPVIYIWSFTTAFL